MHNTVKTLFVHAPQKIVTQKRNCNNCLFYFGYCFFGVNTRAYEILKTDPLQQF